LEAGKLDQQGHRGPSINYIAGIWSRTWKVRGIPPTGGPGKPLVCCAARFFVSSQALRQDFVMHYPHKLSKIKRIRKVGFRARMSTSKGRKIMNNKRRVGRTTDLTR